LTGGWEGLIVVDLQHRTTSELTDAGYPLDIVALPPQDTAEDKGGNMEQLNMALIAAVYQNHLEVAKLLIEVGADVNVQDNTRQSAYLISTAEGYLDLLKLTLEAGADAHSLDSYNGTGLIRAADRGHVEIVEELLKTDITY
jgi:ankyrin repeat protein